MARVVPAGGIERFTNKTVGLRFSGRELRFRLSHALFSSFDIDAGTRLLLKSLAAKVDFGSVRSALDVGCGVGVIGACIASQAPRAKVVMQDRDALAAAFARENCRENGLDVSVSCALGFRGLNGEDFDLVTSNLPAKAGKPVLRMLLRNAAGCLSSLGVSAVVVVAPLALFVQETLAEIGCEVIHHQETGAHAVIHYRAGSAMRANESQREDMAPYIRATGHFAPPGFSYSLQTAYSLPDFDALGYPLELAFELAGESSISGRVLFWNPGQGHLPAGLLARMGRSISSVAIASRDVLQCSISAMNVASAGTTPESIHPLCSEAELETAFPEGAFDVIVAAPQPIPRVPWQPDLARASASILKPGGKLLVFSTSTEMHRFLEKSHGLRLEYSRKRAGFRAATLRKA